MKYKSLRKILKSFRDDAIENFEKEKFRNRKNQNDEKFIA